MTQWGGLAFVISQLHKIIDMITVMSFESNIKKKSLEEIWHYIGEGGGGLCSIKSDQMWHKQWGGLIMAKFGATDDECLAPKMYAV